MEIPHTPFAAPETASLETLALIKTAADWVVDLAGTEHDGINGSRRYMRAHVGIDDPAMTAPLNEGGIPSLVVARPMEKFADQAGFSHIVSYEIKADRRMPDIVSSCFIVIGGAKPSEALFNYTYNVANDAKNPRTLTETEGRDVLFDLIRIIKSSQI